MKKKYALIICLLAVFKILSAQKQAPTPLYPIPSPQQVAWQRMETYAFIHFGPTTMIDQEWGYGDADISQFNPEKLDCKQWVRVLKQAGMKGVILTAKHHDGFCLWPTKLTDYCIRNTPFKNGKGDIVGELAAACKETGLKMGLYLSPWDRHQAFYGTPLYVEYYHRQWEELLTQYGDIFEIWFDGANGGDGWYGGTCERRHIDSRTYYNLPQAYAQAEQLQPGIIIFSDGGPGCRWVGNERGFAAATNWAFLRQGEIYPGTSKADILPTGHPDGNQWTAAECDVSIRPGWFYHEREDDQVKTPEQLAEIYYRSVGHNATMLLNFPVTKEGLIHPTDSAHAVEFHQQIEQTFSRNLLRDAKVKASVIRGEGFGTDCLTDGAYDTYWATPDGMNSATLTFTFKRLTTLNRLRLQEYIPLGQRVKAFTVEYRSGGKWVPIDCGEETTTIGYCRLLRFPAVSTKQIRVSIQDARGSVCLNFIGAYYGEL